MKIYPPVVYSFVCPLCREAQYVHFFKGKYTISDEHCEYSVEFTEPRLVKVAPQIALHKGKKGFWKCPACETHYRLQETEGGFVVHDGRCGVELLISSGSPLLH